MNTESFKIGPLSNLLKTLENQKTSWSTWFNTNSSVGGDFKKHLENQIKLSFVAFGLSVGKTVQEANLVCHLALPESLTQKLGINLIYSFSESGSSFYLFSSSETVILCSMLRVADPKAKNCNLTIISTDEKMFKSAKELLETN